MRNSDVVAREYGMAVAEILEILNHLPQELRKKIPSKLMEFFQEVSIKEDKPPINFSDGLQNINLSNKAKALLAMIYRNYLCSDEERKVFDEKLWQNEELYQQGLREKYHPDAIFKKPIENEKQENNPPIQLIEYKEPKWYHKIFRKIFSLFKK